MWKPIETAPKNWTRIIVRGGKLLDSDNEWWDLEDYDVKVAFYNEVVQSFVTEINKEQIRPTHWIEFPND